MESHAKKVEQLQRAIKSTVPNSEQGQASPLALNYRTGYSNTTRTKSYKQTAPTLDFSQFNEVIRIDPEKKIAIVEPRVTMEALLKATLPHHLIPPILPEFKKITVGGAIMGGAAESSSHEWGCFNDSCLAYEIIDGEGNLLKASPHENSDLYYGIAGSYGSLGALVSAEIQLIPANDFVYLHYHFFADPLEAIEKIKTIIHSPLKPQFMDGMILSKNLAVVIEGSLQPSDSDQTDSLPLFSLQSPFSPWFFQHVKELADSSHSSYSEKMPLEDYLFRYDLGAFWMGAYLFHIPFFTRFLSQGYFKLQRKERFTEDEIHRFHKVPAPSLIGRSLLRPLLDAENLWKLLHEAEEWIQNRAVIQDFCIPETQASNFCKDILNNPAIFPIWLCPIKGTKTPQIFMPHWISNNQTDPYLINFGLYGIPAHSAPIQYITKMLEQKTSDFKGRKVLYSHSYYTQDQFWQIYPRHCYEELRSKAKAHGRWHEITDKVLSN